MLAVHFNMCVVQKSRTSSCKPCSKKQVNAVKKYVFEQVKVKALDRGLAGFSQVSTFWADFQFGWLKVFHALKYNENSETWLC